jgi:hypothetical protein
MPRLSMSKRAHRLVIYVPPEIMRRLRAEARAQSHIGPISLSAIIRHAIAGFLSEQEQRRLPPPPPEQHAANG